MVERIVLIIYFCFKAELDVKYDFSVLKADGTVFGRIGNTVKRFSPEQVKKFDKLTIMLMQHPFIITHFCIHTELLGLWKGFSKGKTI